MKVQLVKTAKVELNNMRLAITKSAYFISDEEERFIVKEIREKGYHVIENAYSKEWCANAMDEIDRCIKEYNDQIWKDAAESDHRLFGINQVSALINEYYQDALARRILQTYEGTEVKDGFTLGAKLNHVEGNAGSGGGWHRDHANVKQSKSILYLTDTTLDHGPFQYIEGSHKSIEVYKDSYKYNYDPFQNRFSDEQVNKLIEDSPERLKTFAAPAGTMILVDTRGIHRGMPINKGVRYALTNYLWFHTVVPSHIAKSLIK
jgi:ectoine hydroxylase-related dioxygenase (phytanoyl-CoA dioxygenase family)